MDKTTLAEIILELHNMAMETLLTYKNKLVVTHEDNNEEHVALSLLSEKVYDGICATMRYERMLLPRQYDALLDENDAITIGDDCMVVRYRVGEISTYRLLYEDEVYPFVKYNGVIYYTVCAPTPELLQDVLENGEVSEQDDLDRYILILEYLKTHDLHNTAWAIINGKFPFNTADITAQEEELQYDEE